MVIHIIKEDNVSKSLCEELAQVLSQTYSAIIRIINYTDIDTILKNSTSNYNIYIDMDIKLDVAVGADLHLSITATSTIDEILDICQFDNIIIPINEKTYWCKNEKGWWYQVPGEQYGGLKNNIICINEIWYNIGEDYYMRTGWQPVVDEDGNNATCFYFSPEDGRLIYSKDKTGRPDPFSFSYPPAVTKYNLD